MIKFCKQGKKRIYIENPDVFPGLEFAEGFQAEYERTVVSSDFFGQFLPAGRILVQHSCWIRPVTTAVKAHLTLARVAGYRHALFGLPEEQYPVLFEHPEYPEILLSTIPLNSFVEGRLAPLSDWRIVFARIKAWLQGEDGVEEIPCSPLVRTAYRSHETLPKNVESDALAANIKWFNNHVFFEYADKTAVFEGYSSRIQASGRQSPRPETRGDCTGEATMIPAFEWALYKSFPAKKECSKIMSYLYQSGKLVDNDPKSPTYGGLFFYENRPVYYGDDNCRAAMSCILASELTENYFFVPNILRTLLCILRTTGIFGFRHNSLSNPASFMDGKTWKNYQEEAHIAYHPHYQAYMWAAFLQAYVLTGHQEFLERSKLAIRMTMDVFPKYSWSNGITQEYARLLLPLAFLVQIEDTEEHRSWLKKVAETLLENKVHCGAIREMMGDMKNGKYPAPRSNVEYGTTEAALIQENGIPACDLLYTTNYAFLGLHEAAVATDDRFYVDAANQLADFLCRIQLKSETQVYLNGCWMRGFDYELWEYFGSSADCGWGAWCVESGWTNTWIAATLGLRQLKRSLLCRENTEYYRKLFPDILSEMQVIHKQYTSKSILSAVLRGAE